ncbi:MAG: hypothetical protein V3U76_07290 [Granulosicoccus sp.]
MNSLNPCTLTLSGSGNRHSRKDREERVNAERRDVIGDRLRFLMKVTLFRQELRDTDTD